MQSERDPAEVAARYRVLKVGETNFELQAGSTKIALKRGSAFIHFHVTPLDLRWHAELGSEPFYAVRFAVAGFDIGHRGEEGWSSNLVDNCLFVIDGEALRYLPLLELTVLSEEQFKTRKARLAAERGKKPSAEVQPGNNSDPPLGSATFTHCPASPEVDIAELLDCTIGVSQPHFEKLVEGCLSGRILSGHFHGVGGALSSSFEYGALRDLIVCAGSEFDVSIDSLSFVYRA